MSRDTDRKRTIEARVDRIRQRIAGLPDTDEATTEVRSILRAIVDLLEDEL